MPAPADVSTGPADPAVAALRDALCAVADGVALFEADGAPILQSGTLRPLDDGPGSLFAQAQRLRDLFRADLAQGWLDVAEGDMEGVLDTVMARFDVSPAGARADAPAIEASWLRLPHGRRLLLQRDVSVDRQRQRDLLERNLHAAREAARLRVMHDALADGIALIGGNGNVVAVNRTLRERGGAAWARAGQRHHIADILWNEVVEGTALKTDAALADELADRRERFEAADGSAELRRTPDGRWVEVRWRKLPDRRRLLVQHDVTERVHHDAALERARLETERAHALLQTVLETMPDGVLLVDANEVCRYANQAAIAMHDVPPDLLRRLPTLPELVQWLVDHGEYGPPAVAPARAAKCLADARAAEGYSDTRQRRNGRWIEYSYFRVHEGSTLAVYRDVTALKVQEAQLAQERDAAQAARDEARGGEPRQVRLPRHHEPRDPHADERRDRHDRAAAGDRSLDRRAARSCADTMREVRRQPAARSSTTSSTSPRSRPAGSSWRQSPISTSRRWCVERRRDAGARAPRAKGLELTVAIAPGVPDAACAAIRAGCARSCSTWSATRSSSPSAARSSLRRRGAAPDGAGACAIAVARHRHRHRRRRAAAAVRARSPRPTPRPPGASAAPASASRSCAG